MKLQTRHSSSRMDLLKQAQAVLALAATPQPQAEAEFLLAAALGISRTRMLAFGNEPVSADEEARFWSFIEQKKQGKPVAYITGETDFCSLTLRCDPRALTPRPETEELVQYASRLFEKGADPDILDLCTGTGCIALALAARFPRGRVTAVDISQDALCLASENARRTKLQERVQFLQSDLFENVMGTFDLIVSNPPYIASGDLAHLSAEVKQEPQLALDGGADGLDIIRRIAAVAADYLNPHGTLAMEIGAGQAPAVCALFDAARWEGGVKKDFAGIERFVFARLK